MYIENFDRFGHQNRFGRIPDRLAILGISPYISSKGENFVTAWTTVL